MNTAKRVVILKHTPCRICSWTLHTADQKNNPGSERVLEYLPKVIFLKFEGVKWKVHKDLDVGVWPLTSVTRVVCTHARVHGGECPAGQGRFILTANPA